MDIRGLVVGAGGWHTAAPKYTICCSPDNITMVVADCAKTLIGF